MQSSTGGLRYNETKPKWSLVDFESLIPMVRVLEYGAKKYNAFNWKKGLPYTETIESMLRHIYAFLNGEDLDPESGLSHIGHIMCNAMFLSYYYEYCGDMDDRFRDKRKKDSETKEEYFNEVYKQEGS